MHMTGACLVAAKNRQPPSYVGPEGCGCLEALRILSGQGLKTFDEASAARFYAKLLVYQNRPKEALPFALKALTYYQRHCGKESIDAYVMHADVAFIYAIIGGECKDIAKKAWLMLRENVSDFQQFLGSDKDTAMYLIKHMGCDELFAQAYHEPNKEMRIQYLTRAMAIAVSIKHGFLARICIELDILGCLRPSAI